MEPQGTAKALIVMTHGYGRTIEHYLPECAFFVRNGYKVLAFDGTGTGMSEGSGLKGLPQHTIDMAHVLDYAEKDPELGGLPLLLYGHSWGGYAANAVSCFKKYPLKGLISVAAYNDSLAIMLPSMERRYGKLTVALKFVARSYFKVLFGRIEGYTSVRGLKNTDCPVFMYHSRDDALVSYFRVFRHMVSELSHKNNIRINVLEDRNHNVVELPERDIRVREIMHDLRKLDPKSQEAEELTREMWELQLEKDEKMLRIFTEFYDRCTASDQ